MENEEMYFEIDTIMIPLEDGSEMECAIMDEFEAEGRNYMVLSPIVGEDEIGEDEYLYRYEEDGDDVILSYIDDEDELARISELYSEMCEEDEES